MRKKIGEFLVHKGILTDTQVETILDYSRKKGLRFGDAGLELGILRPEQLVEAFGPHFRVDFFHVHPEYFPVVTQSLIPVEKLVAWGALPLGYKGKSRFLRSTKQLNLGMLNPDRKEVTEAAQQVAKASVGEKRFGGLKVFLILPEHFLAVIEQVYGLSEHQLVSKNPSEVDPTLRRFLEA